MDQPQPQDNILTIACPVCRSVRRRELRRIGPRHFVECDDCGHEYVNPVPATQPEIHYSFDAGESEALHTQIDLCYLGQVFDRYGLRNGTMLDLGCGCGRLGAGLLASGWDRKNLHFMDNSTTSLESLRETLGDENVFCGDATEPLECGCSFDCILMVEFLEDAVRPVEIMRNALVALRPGGVLIVRALPNNRSLEAFLGGSDWKMRVMDCHYNFFNPGTFSRFVQNFESVVVLEFGCFLQPGFRFYHPVRVARDLGLLRRAAPVENAADGSDQTERAVALLRDRLTDGSVETYPDAGILPPRQASQLASAAGIQEFFDTAHLDYRLSPDFTAVLRKGREN